MPCPVIIRRDCQKARPTNLSGLADRLGRPLSIFWRLLKGRELNRADVRL